MIGHLIKLPSGRYAIECTDDDGAKCLTELSAGELADLFIGGVWIRMRVEHNSNGYYFTTENEALRPFAGMKARAIT